MIPYFKRLRKIRIKDILKDPLRYLGVFSIIFLIAIVFFCSNFNIKNPSLWDFSFLTATSIDKLTSVNLFAESVKNISPETPEMVFLTKNTLKSIASPVIITPQILGTVLEDLDIEIEDRKAIIDYVVKEGDTVSSLAEKFNISVETILWANDLNSKAVIKQGQSLVILPATGLVHHVKKGDTLGAIAKTYKGEVSEIIAFNNLSGEGDIFIGDILLIPDGKMPVVSQPKTYAKPSQIPVVSSYFICPTSTCRITQGLHWYNAIDFDGDCGDPIYASAGGTVQRIRYGWNGGAGNYLNILHPNGIVTMYGHISSSLVKAGQTVSQGQIVALMGGQPGTTGAGISTGCHVHFSVQGITNPFAR